MRWVAGLLIIPNLILVVVVSLLFLARLDHEIGVTLATVDAEFYNAFRNGSLERIAFVMNSDYWTITAERWTGYLGALPLLISRIPSVLAMFMLGLFVGRQRMAERINDYIAPLRSLRRWGFIVGFSLSALIVLAVATVPPLNGILILFFDQFLTGPILAMAYASANVLWFQNMKGTWLLSRLADVGRMALSNYLSQSILMTLIFYGYGLGYAADSSLIDGFWVATLIFFGQMLVSAYWMKWFAFGPMEWLWRMITSWNIQSLLRTAK